MVFRLKSPAFGNEGPIPRKYTADGENLSPPLEWSDPPPGTRSFALIVEDPDAPAGVFRHWGLYNIMSDRQMLPEGIGHGRKTEDLGTGIMDAGYSELIGRPSYCRATCWRPIKQRTSQAAATSSLHERRAPSAVSRFGYALSRSS